VGFNYFSLKNDRVESLGVCLRICPDSHVGLQVSTYRRTVVLRVMRHTVICMPAVETWCTLIINNSKITPHEFRLREKLLI